MTLPWPPSKNGYWRTFRNRQILSAKARAYREYVKQWANPDWLLCPLFGASGGLKVQLEFYPPTRARYDLDGRPSGLLDALTHVGVWGDDSQIEELSLFKRPCQGKPGKVLVTIEEL